MGKKTFSVPCPERIYRCIFQGCDVYQILSKILNSDQWGKRIYSQNQQTYVVCLDPIPWSSDSQNQPEEIDPLEQLLQSTIKKHNMIKTRRPKFLCGEILIEWKKKRSKVNGIVNMVGYIHFNFYIAQSQNVQ
ncbi:unnamed protein product [Rhizophagus irregularis]|nr:unnamed protein product [Rhizophagus irregularis]